MRDRSVGPSVGPVSGALRKVASASLLLFCLSCAREPASRPDAEVVVADVNGSSVTLKDLKSEIAALRGFQPSPSARTATRSEVTEALSRLIERSIVLREGERLQVSVTEPEMEAEVRHFRSDFPPGGLEKSLLQKGIDMEDWRVGLRRTLLFRKSAEAIAKRQVPALPPAESAPAPPPGSPAAPLEKVRVRQFLFDTRDAAFRAVDLIRGRKDPEEIVQILTGGESHPAWVDLGVLSRDELPRELADRIFPLKEGEPSAVIPGDEKSWSVFVVVGREGPGAATKAGRGMREEDAARLHALRESAFRAWLAAEKAKASVRIQEELLNKLSEASK